MNEQLVVERQSAEFKRIGWRCERSLTPEATVDRKEPVKGRPKCIAISQGWRTFSRSRANILNLKNKNIDARHVHYVLLHSLLFTIRTYSMCFGDLVKSMRLLLF